MADLADGESIQVKGSSPKPYTLTNTGGVYSCTCPAWRNQSLAIERRTCKHLRALRGEEAERARVGEANAPARPARPAASPGAAGDEEGEGPPLLLAQSWSGEGDLTGWWMSEKLDGVRAFWDGQRFISRLGNPFHAPDWFTAGLPGTPLDGELWGGRKLFQRTVSIVRRQDKSDAWKEIRYLVFDAPSERGPFEERMEVVKRHLASAGLPHAEALAHERCRGVDHLREELARVEKLGGEGLMLREPGSKYEAGRSSTLLKVKSFFDAEARVVGHQPGQGRHKGRLGALMVELENGIQFSVGTGFSDADRGTPPAVGSVITFRYQELSTGGVPRFPSYVGVREDYQWKGATPKSQPVAAKPAISKPAPEKPVGRPATATENNTREETPMSNPGTRRFEFREGKSSKFWEISLDGNTFSTRYGRIGADGQSTIKEFPTPEKARAEHDKLVAEKVGKGYIEVK